MLTGTVRMGSHRHGDGKSCDSARCLLLPSEQWQYCSALLDSKQI